MNTETEHKNNIIKAMENPNAIIAIIESLDDGCYTVDEIITKGEYWRLEVYYPENELDTLGDVLFGDK